MTSDLPASVRAQLLNFAKEQGIAFQQVLVRYGTERLVYRLNKSEYTEEFVLKGAVLFLSWTNQLHRPTRDVDFLSFGDPGVARFENIFRKVVNTETESDGLEFDEASIEGHEIREGDIYRGIRITLEAHLSGARIPVQVDIGFGDTITPEPVPVELPTLLDFPAPSLRGYTKLTAVAEKFEAIVTLGEINSRMKDFYDIWYLSQSFEFDGPQLRESILSTFKRRNTPIPHEAPIGLTTEFSTIPEKSTQWQSFVENLRPDQDRPTLEELLDTLRQFLWPPVESIVSNDELRYLWKPERGWTEYGHTEA